MREVVTAALQLGPINKADSRETVVERMIALLDQAKDAGATLAVFPELAFTTFFPRWYYEDRAEADQWFEKELPSAATKPLFDRAKEHGIGMCLGYGEVTPDGHHYNSNILTSPTGKIIGKYRKVHLPGHAEYDPTRKQQQLEKRYFEPGNLGFPVFRSQGGIFGMAICNDRRWPETYRVMGLQGVEMVMLGYNTPSVNGWKTSEGPEERLFHHRLSVQSGAYQNSTWVVAVAKAGEEDGFPLLGGSLIVGPNGKIVAESKTLGDEMLVHACDLDECTFGKETIFNFAQHRRVEHYGLITSQTGVVLPPETDEQD